MGFFARHRARCVVALAFSISLPFVAAQSATDAAVADTIVVTGSREPMSALRLAADVVVIGADTLRATTADSLGDLLRREAGVQLSRSGGPGQSSGVLLRGASSAQSVVLVDGVRIGSATLGSTPLESLPLALIDHIEVLRGPGSALHGADAVGGVVQIFTRQGEGPADFEARAALGSHGSHEASGSVRGKSIGAGMIDYAAALAHEDSRGVSALRPGDANGNYNPDSDGYGLDTASLHLGLRPAAGQRLGVSVFGTRQTTRYDASQYLPPDFVQDASPDFRSRSRAEVQSVDWRGDLGGGWVGSARASNSVDDVHSGADVTDRFRTSRRRLGAQIAWQTGSFGQWVAAAEHGEDKAQSTSFLADVQRRTDAVTVEWTGQAGPASWQFGLRHDHSSDFGRVTTGRIGGAWQVVPGLKLRALVGNTYRAPAFNDQYFPGYGVPGIKPERGRSVELGLGWRTSVAEASATIYRNLVRELIGYQPERSLCPANPAYDFGCAGNTSRARLQGVTVAGSQRVDAFVLRAGWDLLAANDTGSGQRLTRRAVQQGSLGIAWSGGDWTLAGNLLHLGSRPDLGRTLASETPLDLSATWRATSAWQVQARLLNATNERIEPARDFRAPGRQAWLVLRWEPPL